MNKIYTGYCARLRDYPNNALTIGVMRFPPKWFTGINLDILAPSEELLLAWKNEQVDKIIYKIKYLNELRERGLQPDEVKEKLLKVANGMDIILCCYERPDDFCHRHILNEWLSGDGEFILS